MVLIKVCHSVLGADKKDKLDVQRSPTWLEERSMLAVRGPRFIFPKAAPSQLLEANVPGLSGSNYFDLSVWN